MLSGLRLLKPTLEQLSLCRSVKIIPLCISTTLEKVPHLALFLPALLLWPPPPFI